MPYLLYSSSINFSQKRKKIFFKKSGFGFSLATFFLFFAIFLLFGSYIYLTLELTKINFLLEKLDKRKTEAEIEYQKIQTQLKDNLSLEKIKPLIEEFGLTKPNDFYFLSIKEVPSVSLKKK